MTTAVRKLLDTFDALPVTDQHDATIEILRRAPVGETGDVPDDCLLEAADELFRQMDAEDEQHAASLPGRGIANALLPELRTTERVQS